MDERAAFLKSIEATPDDDGPRLAFADWLERRGDPFGEFIRVQCALEPVRGQDGEHVRKLRQREEELLNKNTDAFLGSLWAPAYAFEFLPVFRRGVVERVALPAPMFVEHGLDLAKDFPLNRELVLYDVRDRGDQLAKLPLLGRYPHVGLYDWLTENDAKCLASSPCLRDVQSLTIWLGGRHEEAVCRTFAQAPVCELRLVQLLGGIMAGEQSDALSAQAEARAAETNRMRGSAAATVVRAFEQSFAVDDNSGRGLYTGWLPGGLQCLAAQTWDGDFHVVVFDTRGKLLTVMNRSPEWPASLIPAESLPPNVDREELVEAVRRALGREPRPNRLLWDDSPEQALAYLQEEFDFTAGTIHVKEFATDKGLSLHHLPRDYADIAANPDGPPFLDTEEERIALRSDLSRWLIRGDFVIEWGNDFWAGPDGIIHSS